MHRTNLRLTALAVAVFGFASNGCTPSQPDTTTPPDQSSTSANEIMDQGDHDDAGASDMDKMKAELSKLPEADRAAAEKQHMCPVSGEMLGTMGTPLKVAVKGQDVWLCCESCKEKLLESPDEFLAKLPK